MARLAAYGCLTCAAAAYVVFSAFRQRSNFFAAAVHLSKSNASMMILWNFGVFITILIGRALQAIFFGSLRLIEIERLHERAWYAVTESLLALTIFRESFDTTFVILFVSLLFLKVFHWLASDRVEMMEQAPSIPRIFHFRMITVLSTLWFSDILLVAFAADSILTEGPSVMIMFASEYMIMLATLVGTTLKYGANAYDLRNDVPWENKSVFVFYVELACDFLKLATYLCFFSLILTFYGLPLNILRDVYITARSFVVKIRDLSRYRQATRNMDQRYPNATPEEMERLSDKTCIICREDMEAVSDSQQQARAQEPRQGPNDTPKKLPCGHIFHFHCLRSWLERQQSCPTCRRPVLSTTNASTRELAVQAPPAGPNQPGVNRNNALNGPAAPQPGAVPTPTRSAAHTQHLAVPSAGQLRSASSAGQPRARPRPGKENPLVAFQMRSASKPPVSTPPNVDTAAGASVPSVPSVPSPHDPTAAKNSQARNESPNADAVSKSASPTKTIASVSNPQSDMEARLAQRKQQLEAALRRQGASSTVIPSTPQTPAAKAPSPGTSPQLSNPIIKIDDEFTKPTLPSPENMLPARTNSSQPQSAVVPIMPFPRQSSSQFSFVAPPSSPGSAFPPGPSNAASQIQQQQIHHSGINVGSMPRLIPFFDPSDPTKPNAMARFFPSLMRSGLFSSERAEPVSEGIPQHSSPASTVVLPEDLSDDQLASLAEVTREGLETRLRLLNSTQDTLRACVDQIQKAMKVIDSGDVQGVLQVVAETQRTGSGGGAAADTNGKGKDPESVSSDEPQIVDP